MIHTRTIHEAAVHFKTGDPQSSLTETAIRRLIRNGDVPSVKVGKKYLVTLEALEAYLAGSRQKPTMSEETDCVNGCEQCQKN